jgi:hypothetical protein
VASGQHAASSPSQPRQPACDAAAMWLPSLGRGRSFLNWMGKIFLNFRRALLKLCDYLVNFQNPAHQIRSRIDASRGTNSTTRLLIPSKVTFQPSSRMGQ